MPLQISLVSSYHAEGDVQEKCAVTFYVSLTGKAQAELECMKGEVKLFKEGHN